MSKLSNLTKAKLVQLYLTEKRSLDEVGRLYNASRVAVYKKLFNILYKNYPNIIFLERKYNKFLEGFERSILHGKRA